MRLFFAMLAITAFIAVGGCSGDDDHAGHDHDGCGCATDTDGCGGGGTPPAKAGGDTAPDVDAGKDVTAEVTFACAKDG